MEHELTYREDADEQGYGDGLEDVYDCTCGRTFQANGDIQDAFDHGRETGVVLVTVEGGMASAHSDDQLDIFILDWDNFEEATDTDGIDEATAWIEALPEDVRNIDRAGILANLERAGDIVRSVMEVSV